MNKVKNKRGVCKMSGVKNYTTTMLAEQQWHQQVEREGEREREREGVTQGTWQQLVTVSERRKERAIERGERKRSSPCCDNGNE